MGREMVVGLLALTVSILPPYICPAQQDPVVPFVVEQVRFVAPVREDSPPSVEITVRNTGTRLIEAWGVAGEVP